MVPVSNDIFGKLSELDTCSVSNAIERFNVRLRNEGFVSGMVKARFPHLPPMLGYAATARVRSSSTPIRGNCYFDRIDFWNFLDSIPAPRVIVLQDVDRIPGHGALFGEIHASIAQALKSVGCVTSGAVRDLSRVEALEFPLFSRRVSVSHAYAHMVDFGEPVEIGGLIFKPGDLVHGDRNGVQTIPLEIAGEVPEMVREIQEQEDQLMRFCRSGDFSLAELSERIRPVATQCRPPVPAVTS